MWQYFSVELVPGGRFNLERAVAQITFSQIISRKKFKKPAALKRMKKSISMTTSVWLQSIWIAAR
jgi:hypothetical protein